MSGPSSAATLQPLPLLLALLAVSVYGTSEGDVSGNQTSPCHSCCRGPPGKDGRDGPPGPSSPLSVQDYLTIKKELEQDLKTQLLSEQSFTIEPENGKGGNCTADFGKTENNPASSCKAIFLCDEETPSGRYWIKIVEEKKIVIKCIYCNMKDIKCGIRGGWMRVAHIDMTNNQSATCPPPLAKLLMPPRCARPASAGGCTSVTFSTCGVPYTRVCGRAVGYAYHSPDAFDPKAQGINGAYVDGLSITHGQPRKHIWTYAAGLSEDASIYPTHNCPCALHPGSAFPPTFVGQHYHCESGNTGVYEPVWYTGDPLWDGKGCDAGSNCCANSDLPWFCRTLACETKDDIEIRLCTDGPTTTDENVAIEQLEIYVL